MAKERAAAAHSANSEDLKKPRNSTGARSIHSMSNAAATFLGGGAGSLASALQVFSKRLEQEDASPASFTNAWMTSVLEAYAGFFEQMAETSRRLIEETRNASSTGIAGAGVAIDYERLARLVANELRKQKIHEETA